MASKTQTQASSAMTSVHALASQHGRIGRRLIPSVTVFVIWLVLRSLRNQSAASLQNEAFATGYSLAAICVFLMLLGVRKRVLSVQIGRLACAKSSGPN